MQAAQDVRAINDMVERESAFIDNITGELAKTIVGQRYMVERILIGLLAGGHCLIEGVPGLAKTLTVKTLAQTLEARFQRLQFTPDLLPADITGTTIYNMQTAEFTQKLGPIFANLVLADEINRAPAKVQSALLEAMEERQVTIGDRSLVLPDPFTVFATQNPLDHDGTYPLPAAQLDRFLLKLQVSYPDRASEAQLIARLGNAEPTLPQPLVEVEQLRQAMQLIRQLHMAEEVRSYLLELVSVTRNPADFGLTELDTMIDHGISPRGTLCLALAAKAKAFLAGRPYVIPDDVISMAPLVMRHRLSLSYTAATAELSADQVIRQILGAVAAP